MNRPRMLLLVALLLMTLMLMQGVSAQEDEYLATVNGFRYYGVHDTLLPTTATWIKMIATDETRARLAPSGEQYRDVDYILCRVEVGPEGEKDRVRILAQIYYDRSGNLTANLEGQDWKGDRQPGTWIAAACRDFYVNYFSIGQPARKPVPYPEYFY